MGSHPIIFLWLWPATHHEPRCRHVPINTHLKADWIYSTKRMMTLSYGWNLQRLQHSRNNNLSVNRFFHREMSSNPSKITVAEFSSFQTVQLNRADTNSKASTVIPRSIFVAVLNIFRPHCCAKHMKCLITYCYGWRRSVVCLSICLTMKLIYN